jgi:hypothetical protein
LRILLLGDLVGRPGRRAVAAFLEDRSFDLVVANGENAAGGFGITPKIVGSLREAGVDVVTSGNHIWACREVFSMLEDYSEQVLRPANLPAGNPGRGWTVVEAGGLEVLVVNLQGRVFMNSCASCPFREADRIIAARESDLVLVDFHAEATSEKQAMGFHLDGRVTVMAGTHTHVLTADDHLLPGGTLYISDLGMCGCPEGIIGMDPRASMERLLLGRPGRLKVAESDGRMVNGISLEVSPKGELVGWEAVNERL